MARNADLKRKRAVDLSGHHALCEMNFHMLIRLLPGIKQGVDNWSFNAGRGRHLLKVDVSVLEACPYTTTIDVRQDHASMETPRIVVRLYHDVNMAEIIAWDHHRHWAAQYEYPNKKMYHPDEKLALNQFLSDWLQHCKNEGFGVEKTVIQFS
ncbi:hypothetical protein TDB9533_02972 [Thalassocella blandensis]|nr:hypothetical protein TDB9533_02972 [Thalassocella blandensis]